MNNSSQFPAPSSQQRVSAATTTSGRNKVQLKPGRSLMDWIRLVKSGRDMTGLKGRFIEVTPEELAKHNKKTDCWICIRGLVYNVTSYLEYHPGGEEELMKGAGADATELFDQIHSWVNYNSMLKECLVGRMSSKPIHAAKVSVKQPGLTVQRETLLDFSRWRSLGTTVTDGSEKRPQDISPSSLIVDSNALYRMLSSISPRLFRQHLPKLARRIRAAKTWEHPQLDIAFQDMHHPDLEIYCHSFIVTVFQI